jgi:hypothetical protein
MKIDDFIKKPHIRLEFPKMNFRWLKELSKEFGGIGLGPSPAEIMAMTASVPQLARDVGHDVIHFWGKVTGTIRNYLIVVCYTGGLLGSKTYYASLDGVTWFGLPVVTFPVLFHASHIRSRITGNPLTKTMVRHPRKPLAIKEFEPLIPPKPRNEEEEEEEDVPEQKDEGNEEEEHEEEEELPEYESFSISEDQRIACLVSRIDKNGLIFPQDALLWSSTSSVATNPLFKGLPTDVTLDDFCRIEKNLRGEKARKDGIVDTMPLLSEDLPAQGWKISTMTFSPVIKITSRLWPGLCFISKGIYWGTVYLGNAEKNIDYLFASE